MQKMTDMKNGKQHIVGEEDTLSVKELFERLYQRLELRVLARYNRRNDFKLHRLYDFMGYLTLYEVITKETKEEMFSAFIDHHWQMFVQEVLPTRYPTIQLKYDTEDVHVYFESKDASINQLIELLATSEGYIELDEKLGIEDVSLDTLHTAEQLRVAVQRLKKVEEHLNTVEQLNEEIEAFKHDAPILFLKAFHHHEHLYEKGQILYKEYGQMF